MRYPTQFERDKINDPLYLVAFWRRPAREQHTMYRTMLNLFLQKGVPRYGVPGEPMSNIHANNIQQ